MIIRARWSLRVDPDGFHDMSRWHVVTDIEKDRLIVANIYKKPDSNVSLRDVGEWLNRKARATTAPIKFEIICE